MEGAKYTCPKCGSALQFWMRLHDSDYQCACGCSNRNCYYYPKTDGRGTDAASAFKDWETKNTPHLKKLS